METMQLIYSSQPFGFDAAILNGVLLDARRCNNRTGITGALICRRDIYLQLLEGPETPVLETYERICRDDRHAGIKKLVESHVPHRLFEEWDMLHDPARSWLWSSEEIAGGALDRARADDIRKIFVNLSTKAKAAPSA